MDPLTYPRNLTWFYAAVSQKRACAQAPTARNRRVSVSAKKLRPPSAICWGFGTPLPGQRATTAGPGAPRRDIEVLAPTLS